jgi:DNA-binding response OmpR family regulator
MGEILLVEDSADISLIVRRTLEPENRVTACATLADASQKLGEKDFDLIILDVGLPDGDGFEFLAKLRQTSPKMVTPTIFITGRAGVSDQVLGYSLGAEDYILKPFQPMVLQAKIRAKLRGIQAKQGDHDILDRGDIRLDVGRQKVFVADKEAQLTSTEFKILLHLMRHVEQVYSRDQLITAIWGENTHVIDRTIDTHISHLRTKLQSARCNFEAVQGTGYRFTFK